MKQNNKRFTPDNNKVFFTLVKVTRGLGPGEIKYDHPQGYKFLWDKGGIKLVQYYVGDKVYKP